MKTQTAIPSFRAVALTIAEAAGSLATLPVRRWLAVLGERRRLAALDPRLLDDIGVDAAARASELDKPFWAVTSRR